MIYNLNKLIIKIIVSFYFVIKGFENCLENYKRAKVENIFEKVTIK